MGRNRKVDELRYHRRLPEQRGTPLNDALGSAWNLVAAGDPKLWGIVVLSLRVSGAATLLAALIGIRHARVEVGSPGNDMNERFRILMNKADQRCHQRLTSSALPPAARLRSSS